MRRLRGPAVKAVGLLLIGLPTFEPFVVHTFAAEAQIAARWIGQDEDVTGIGQVKADGGKDGHFRVTLSFPSSTEVRSLAVYSATPEGTPAGGQVWHTGPTVHWIAGILRSGTRLHDGKVSTLGRFEGEISLDVYCSDSGWFKSKNYFRIEAELAGGQKLYTVVPIGEPAGAAPPSTAAPTPAISSTLPAPGDPGVPAAVEVVVLAYGKDETDGSEVGWNALYPHPSFDDDPNRRGLPNAKWIGAHWWQGNNLCLAIKGLEAPWPPNHRLAIGYTVTLGGGRFADGTQTKTFILYRYNGAPSVKDFSECHPVTEWKR